MTWNLAAKNRVTGPVRKNLLYQNPVYWAGRSVSSSYWMAVAYGANRFVAIALDSTPRGMTSEDATTWTNRTPILTSEWNNLIFDRGLFVATGQPLGGGTGVMTSSDGITWTSRTPPGGTHDWYSVAGNGSNLFVISGTGGVATSPDAVTWTNRGDVFGGGGNAVSMAFGAGLFVAVGGFGLRTSPDGITWTARTAPAGDWQALCYGAGLFVAVASGGANRIMTSIDGINWTARTNPVAANQYFAVAYGGGLFFALAFQGSTNTRSISSPDGINWTPQNIANLNWRSITFGKNRFVAVASGANQVATWEGPTQNEFPSNIDDFPLAFVFSGAVTVNAMINIPLTDDLLIPFALVGSKYYNGVNPATASQFTLTAQPSNQTLGYVRVGPNGQAAFQGVGGDVAAGQTLRMQATTVGANLANVGITIRAARVAN